jgi:hypothetical protein
MEVAVLGLPGFPYIAYSSLLPSCDARRHFSSSSEGVSTRTSSMQDPTTYLVMEKVTSVTLRYKALIPDHQQNPASEQRSMERE